ncbi:MAG: hypothetical protein ACFNP4_04590 [Capnocytophaga gingivalis]|uniref:hypothetical protein n=1 Tax=Capnocytophaga gingivalis TaxID=1017 RepID=UPI003613A581
MYKKLIIRERDKYLFDIGRSWLNTDDSTNRGDLFDIRKSWGDFPSEEDEVAFLSFILEKPSLAHFPNEIARLSSLKALQIPVQFLPLSEEQLPNHLISLTIDNLSREEEQAGKHYSWNPLVKMENLECFRILGDDNGDLLGISPEIAPNLKWIEVELFNPNTIHIIKEFKCLEAAILGEVGNIDVFEHLKHLNLKIVSAKSPKKGFDYTKISYFKALEIVRLFSIKEEIDCAMFLEFPHLKELLLYNCKKLKNVETFLEMPVLKSLNIEDAKGISKELKASLKEHIPQCEV